MLHKMHMMAATSEWLITEKSKSIYMPLRYVQLFGPLVVKIVANTTGIETKSWFIDTDTNLTVMVPILVHP